MAMITMKKLISALLFLLVLSGCATSVIANKDAKPVPADRIFLNGALPVEGNARTLFVRDVGLVGSGVYQNIFIDGRKAASLNPGEKVEFILPPGEHIFGVIPTDAFGTHALNTIDQDLKPDRKYYYRIQTDGNSFRSVVQRFIPNEE